MKCLNDSTVEKLTAWQEQGGSIQQQTVDETIVALSKCKDLIRLLLSFVKQQGGRVEDLEDLFQDTLIQLMKNLFLGKYNGSSSIENYTIGIFKNKLANRRQKRDEEFVDPILPTTGVPIPVEKDAPDLQLEHKERISILESFVLQLGGRCQELLKRWSLNIPYRETAQALGMTEHKVNDSTYECRKKLRDMVEKHPQYKALANGLRFSA